MDDTSGTVQAAADGDVLGVQQRCSSACSPWFMAHVGDILAADRAAPGILGRNLPHAGGDQVQPWDPPSREILSMPAANHKLLKVSLSKACSLR